MVKTIFVVAVGLALVPIVAWAANEVYTYDNAGRLIVVDHGDGRTTTYTLDPAGNRTALQTSMQAAPPDTVTAPSSSTSGSYSVSWTASASPGVTTYKLWEATNAAFTGETLIHTGSSPASISGRGNGTFYYRVQSCEGAVCGPPRAANNPVVVGLPPGAPASITAPATNSTGSYSISWAAPASGVVTGYQVQEATSVSFSSPTTIYTGSSTSTSVSGRLTGTTYYYRVQACNGSACGGYTASSGTAVTLAPPTPASLTNPLGDPDGTFNVSWTTVTGPVTAYELWEATNSSFTGEVRIYNSTGSLFAVTGRANGTYYYRVRACNAAGCGGYRPGATGTTVAVPPGAPASITVPGTSSTGSFTISWTAGSGTNTGYELYESTSPSFATQSLVYSGASTSTALSGRANGTYYYRVRGCNVGSCGQYREGVAGIVVTLPAGAPASISFTSPDYDGSYNVTWATVSGPVSAYEVYEALNSGFSGQTQVYSGTGSSVALSGRGNGAYYYRVRACNAGGCSGYTAGSGAMTVALTPNAPATINVPGSAFAGSYTISWAAPSGSVVTGYELYESATSNFSSQTLVSSTTGTSANLSNSNVTLYYRVRACNGAGNCGVYATGANGIVVSPQIPSSISVPTNGSGSISLSWGSSPGTITAYEVFEATNSGFSGQTLVYQSTGLGASLTGRGNGTYYYRVRACNGGTNCSDWRTGSNSSVVVIPPSSLTVPANTTNGSFTISWPGAGGSFDRYELYKANNSGFSGESLVYQGSSTSQGFSGETNGTFYFRIRVCTSSYCSSMTAGGNPLVSSYPPSAAPMSIQEVPNWDDDGSYSIGWGTAGVINEFFQLFEANNPSFSGETKVYEGSSQGTSLSGRAEGDYYYRVRACVTWPTNCGPFRTRSNVMRVTFPPNPPSSFTVPATSSGSHTLTWGAPSNHYDGFNIQESLSAAFQNPTNINPGNNLSITLSGRATGTYYYRVQSVWSPTGVTSAWVTGANSTVVNTPPPIPNVPGGISFTPIGNGRNYTVQWTAPPAGGAAVNHYRLLEIETGELNMGTVLSKSYTKPNSYMEFHYQVRACASSDTSQCSGYTDAVTKIVCPTTGCP